MKVGILTFHCAHNYGAVLQAYALQQYILSLGHTVEIIDIRPSFLSGYKRTMWRRCISLKHPIKSIKKIKDEMKIFKLRKKRWDGFNDFINKRLILSERCNQVPETYDAYIVGSDQVWNLKTTKGIFYPYFCDFQFSKNNKIYASYAASMEITKLSKYEDDIIKSKLMKFDYIGVREKGMIPVLDAIGKPIFHTLDPTLLADKTIWNEIILPQEKRNKYVLLYKVWNNINSRRIAHSIAEQLETDVIELVSWLDPSNRKNKFQASSPEEFVTLIKNAEYVITDSFHGTAFSILFSKNFYCVNVNDGQSRMQELLHSIGLENRFVNGHSNPKPSMINYDTVSSKLINLQIKSRDFINLILSTDY